MKKIYQLLLLELCYLTYLNDGKDSFYHKVLLMMDQMSQL